MMTLVCAILMSMAPENSRSNKVSNKVLFGVTAVFDCLNFIVFSLIFL